MDNTTNISNNNTTKIQIQTSSEIMLIDEDVIIDDGQINGLGKEQFDELGFILEDCCRKI